jgi:hypothetical protein
MSGIGQSVAELGEFLDSGGQSAGKNAMILNKLQCGGRFRGLVPELLAYQPIEIWRGRAWRTSNGCAM